MPPKLGPQRLARRSPCLGWRFLRISLAGGIFTQRSHGSRAPRDGAGGDSGVATSAARNSGRRPTLTGGQDVTRRRPPSKGLRSAAVPRITTCRSRRVLQRNVGRHSSKQERLRALLLVARCDRRRHAELVVDDELDDVGVAADRAVLDVLLPSATERIDGDPDPLGAEAADDEDVFVQAGVSRP